MLFYGIMFIGIIFSIISYVEMKYVGIIIGLEIISLGIIMYIIYIGYNIDDIYGSFVGLILIISGIVEIGVSIAVLVYCFGG